MLEKVQARATKLIPTLKDLPYQDWISRLNLTTLEDRRRRGDLIGTYRVMHQIDKINPYYVPATKLRQDKRTLYETTQIKG